MARMYADETFPARVVKLLRDFRHDILTAKETGKASMGMSDEEVLAFANQENRAFLTLDRANFIKLHDAQPMHSGIICCRIDMDRERMASRINEAIFWVPMLNGQLVRVYYPPAL